jgi:hypothetical protein
VGTAVLGAKSEQENSRGFAVAVHDGAWLVNVVAPVSRTMKPLPEPTTSMWFASVPDPEICSGIAAPLGGGWTGVDPPLIVAASAAPASTSHAPAVATATAHRIALSMRGNCLTGAGAHAMAGARYCPH